MPSQPRLRQQPAMYQIQEGGCSRSYFEGRLALDLIPSTCSFRLVDTLCHIGSSTKSIPRLRAYFAAGTKSESPEMRMICVTRSRSANEAISRPIRISTPFCVMVSRISRSVKLSTVLLPAHRSSVLRAAACIHRRLIALRLFARQPCASSPMHRRMRSSIDTGHSGQGSPGAS